MRKILLKTGKLFLILSATAVVAVTGLYLFANFYGDRIKQSIVAELNKQIGMKIDVAAIDFSVFDNFPYASLGFHNVSSKGKNDSRDHELIRAGEVSILFNIVDIIRGNYSIEKVLIRDAFLDLTVDQNGNRNFDVFNESEGRRNSSALIDLQKVIFINTEISYFHFSSAQEYLFRIDKGTLKGRFSSEEFQTSFRGSLFSSYFKSGKLTLFNDRYLDLDFDLSGDPQTRSYLINKCNIVSNDIGFDISGQFTLEPDDRQLNLEISAGSSKLTKFMELIPEDYLKPLRNYKLSGELALKASVNGFFDGDQIPSVHIDFNLDNGEIGYLPGSFRLARVSLDGSFDNGDKKLEKTFSLNVDHVVANIDGGSVSGNIAVNDFTRPEVKVQLNTRFDLSKLKTIYDLKQLKSMTGQLELHMEFVNRLQNFRAFGRDDFLSSKTSGTMEFSKMDFQLEHSPLSFSDFNGAFQFNNKDLMIDSFTGNVSGNDFSMQGYFANILAYAFKPEEPMSINATFASENFNLDELLNVKNNSDETEQQLRFTKRIDFNLNVKIDTFRFRKFTGSQLTGKLIQKKGIFYLKEGKLNAMNGKVELNGSIDGTENDLYHINCNAGFEAVDIHQLFSEFGNFRQNNLTSKNLAGTVNATVHYTSSLTPDLYVDPASVFTLADIEIKDGELIGYTPLFALSKYIKKQELDDIHFSTLKNSIRIENRVVYIPEMEISSSTLDLNLYGKHDFDNLTDYHVRLYLEDLIGKNERKPGEFIEGIFESEEDGGKPMLFLSVTGPADDPVIRYDTKEVGKKIASDMAHEKQELKSAIRKEFHPGDSRTKQEAEDPVFVKSDDRDFKVGWDEVKQNSLKKVEEIKATEANQKQVKKEKDFIIIFDETSDTIHRQ